MKLQARLRRAARRLASRSGRRSVTGRFRRDVAPRAAAALGLLLMPAVPCAGGVNRWTTSGPGDSAAQLEDVAAHPERSELLAAWRRDRGVFVSTDGGATWTPANGREPDPEPIGLVAWDPHDDARLYRLSDGGLAVSDDLGRTWSELVGPDRWFDPPVELLADPLTPKRLLVAVREGVHESLDGGATWRRLGEGWPAGGAPHALVLAPSEPDVLWAATQASLLRLEPGAGAGEGAWTDVVGPFSECWIALLAVSPVDPDEAWAFTVCSLEGGDLHHTADGGDTWSRLPGIGLPAHLTLLGAHPTEPGVLFSAANRDDQLSWSADGGASWLDVGAGADFGRVQAIALSAAAAERVVVAADRGAFRATAGDWDWLGGEGLGGRRSLALATGVIDPELVLAGVPHLSTGTFRSVDGGLTWRSASGLPRLRAGGVAADPFSAWTFLAFSADRNELARSTNGGLTWVSHGTLLRGRIGSPLRADPHRADHWLAVPEGGGPLFQSVDGGRSWNEIVTWRRDEIATWVAFDPVTPGRVVVTVGPESAAGWTTRVSEDGGETWGSGPELPDRKVEWVLVRPGTWIGVATGDGEPPLLVRHDEARGALTTAALPAGAVLTSLVGSPATPSTLHVAVPGRGVLRSVDLGETWCELHVHPMDRLVENVVAPPRQPRTLHAATRSGAWSITLEDPDVELEVRREDGDVVLSWDETSLPLAVRRGEIPSELAAVSTCGASSPFADPVATDGRLWYYRVGW